MEKGFKVWRLRSVVPAGLITAGLITASAVIGLPGRTEQNALSPAVQRRVATVILAQRIRAYAAMAQAHSLCLVQKGSLRPPQAVQALKITLQDLGIDPAVLTNPFGGGGESPIPSAARCGLQPGSKARRSARPAPP